MRGGLFSRMNRLHGHITGFATAALEVVHGQVNRMGFIGRIHADSIGRRWAAFLRIEFANLGDAHWSECRVAWGECYQWRVYLFFSFSAGSQLSAIVIGDHADTWVASQVAGVRAVVDEYEVKELASSCTLIVRNLHFEVLRLTQLSFRAACGARCWVGAAGGWRIPRKSLRTSGKQKLPR